MNSREVDGCSHEYVDWPTYEYQDHQGSSAADP